jgi:hypothetical protein
MAARKKASQRKAARRKPTPQKAGGKKMPRKKDARIKAARRAECMVIMPFGASDSKYLSQQTYETIIVPAIRRALGRDANFYRFDQKDVHGPIKTEILESLRRADVVVADISEHNPNVMFELGYRIAQEKPIVLITNNVDSIRFWPRTYQILDYSKSEGRRRIPKMIKEAYDGVRKRLKTAGELNRLFHRVHLNEEQFDNPFQDRMAAWRIERCLEQIKSIQGGDWGLDAQEPPNYIAFIFEGLIKLLERGEEYCTLSNREFWSQKGVGESSLLESNVDAVCRGATIKRVFLIDKNTWDAGVERDEVLHLLEMHAAALSDVRGRHHGKLMVKCLLTDQYERYQNDKHHHFGMMRHMTGRKVDDGRLLILPRYAKDGTISGLNLVFSGESLKHILMTDEYLGIFNRLFGRKDAIDVQEFLRSVK